MRHVCVPVPARLRGVQLRCLAGTQTCETVQLLGKETPEFISPDLWTPDSPYLQILTRLTNATGSVHEETSL